MNGFKKQEFDLKILKQKFVLVVKTKFLKPHLSYFQN